MNNAQESSTLPITVLMSVYNGERWLSEAVQSILDQTFKNFEFIIVNDGSNDKSLEIINNFATLDTRIRIINKLNTGLSDSLNQGIILAKGEWIARIDADDISMPDRLQKQYELAQTDSALVLIGSGLIEINPAGALGKVYLYPASHKALLHRLTVIKPFFSHSSAFYRVTAVRELCGYRGAKSRAEDYDLWLRLSEIGKISCITDVLVKIRKHPDQISHDENGRRQIIDARTALTGYWLRQLGFEGPEASILMYSDFQLFNVWVEDRLNRSNIFTDAFFINKIKQELNAADQSFISRVRLSVSVLCQPAFLFRFLRQKLFGESLSKRMAIEWMISRETRQE